MAKYRQSGNWQPGRAPKRSRWWPLSAAPTWANPRSSTASPTAAAPSSATSPASPATASTANTSGPAGSFRLVDTGGIVPDDPELIPTEIYAQAKVALEEADALVLVVDARTELASPDYDLVAC